MKELTPFDTFVVKIASQCNLNCSYCYMYNLQDDTYKNQPAIMNEAIAKALGKKISLHAKEHGLSAVHVIFHGGEPLLVGKNRFRRLVNILKSEINDTIVVFSVQSNGTLVNTEWAKTFVELEIPVGISIDGPKYFNDIHRLYKSGKGSFDKTLKGIRTLQHVDDKSRVFGAVMAVVNTDIPPAEMYSFWKFLDVESFDLSLPHANLEYPPSLGSANYGEWMKSFFDLWFDENNSSLQIRYFENILRTMFGYNRSTDNIGGKPVSVVVVETDGGIEPTDAFKCCENGITKVGLNVISNDFDELYSSRFVEQLQAGSKSLCKKCQSCELINVCGGGYMPHRYSKKNGFDNPSIYCDDLYNLIHHIRKRVIETFPKDLQMQIPQVIKTRTQKSIPIVEV
jgi:uncharacterized protein